MAGRFKGRNRACCRGELLGSRQPGSREREEHLEGNYSFQLTILTFWQQVSCDLISELIHEEVKYPHIHIQSPCKHMSFGGTLQIWSTLWSFSHLRVLFPWVAQSCQTGQIGPYLCPWSVSPMVSLATVTWWSRKGSLGVAYGPVVERSSTDCFFRDWLPCQWVLSLLQPDLMLLLILK